MLERLRALFKAPARQWAFQTSIFFKASKHKLPLLSSIRTGPKLYESTRSPCFLQAPYELVLLCFQLNRKFVNIIDHIFRRRFRTGLKSAHAAVGKTHGDVIEARTHLLQNCSLSGVSQSSIRDRNRSAARPDYRQKYFTKGGTKNVCTLASLPSQYPRRLQRTLHARLPGISQRGSTNFS